MVLPAPLETNVYKARLDRFVDVDTALLHLDLGFGIWILGTKFPGGPDASQPRGRYQLNGISLPQLDEPGGREAMNRLEELAAMNEEPGALLAKTTKRGKRVLVDLFVRTASKNSDPFTDGTVSAVDEESRWLQESELLSMVRQTASNSESSVVRAMATEILWRRRQLRGGGDVLHLNEQLVEEGLARPYERRVS